MSTPKGHKRSRFAVDQYVRMVDGRSEETAMKRYGRRPDIPADAAHNVSPPPRWFPTNERVPKDATCSECSKPIEERGKAEVWRESRSGALAHRQCALAARGRAAAAYAL